MRRTIIIFVVLLFAGGAYAADPFPVDYQCVSDPSRPTEAVFCEVFRIQLIATGMFKFDIDRSRPFFMIVVLPTVRDGYLSVTVASNFIYPPFAGLALSAYISSYMVDPVQGEDLERCAEYMVKKNLVGISQWMVWFEEKIGIVRPNPRSLEVKNE